jgi:hypothetical protein
MTTPGPTPLTDEYLARNAETLLNELSMDLFGNPHADMFSRKDLIPQLVSFARAEISGEFEFLSDQLDQKVDLRPGVVLSPGVERARAAIIEMLRTSAKRLQSPERL